MSEAVKAAEAAAKEYAAGFVYGAEFSRFDMEWAFQRGAAWERSIADLPSVWPSSGWAIECIESLVSALKLAKDHSELEDEVLEIVDAALAKAEGGAA
ncbi:hypothetical protein RJJ65_32340 [Rhizobium hidalgonense]|uniref:Uncharacterized protein n=1 Tax=Rhizobium hidalgonense TaxID=1538159 RepID=A0AAJ2H1G1_9HYPH|nr:hypothetical protein [Rhizobium hidalgonense]MDR9777249.1 hypothetical protein [Rhizobium hidalgonense]